MRLLVLLPMETWLVERIGYEPSVLAARSQTAGLAFAPQKKCVTSARYQTHLSTQIVAVGMAPEMVAILSGTMWRAALVAAHHQPPVPSDTSHRHRLRGHCVPKYSVSVAVAGHL